jgi:hypothetical protein
MRKHHKEDSSDREISFRKISVRESISKDNSVRGRSPRWKDTFAIDDKGGEIDHMQDRNDWRESTEACRQGEKPQGEFSQGEQPQREIPFSIDVKGGEIETFMKSISMNVITTKCCHQCQRGRLSDSWLRLMDSWYGLLVVIDVNHWRVMLYIDVNPWKNSGSKFR